MLATEQDFYNSNNDLLASPLQFENRTCSIREGQLLIDLARRVPPLEDEELLRFAEYIDTYKLPELVSNHPFVKRTGAVVDLSDNRVQSKGLEELLMVLMRHQVPCTLLKLYRNVLDDSVIDCLVTYLFIQPATMPLSGLHLSHNRISGKGAMRLVKGILDCGQYPMRMSRKPFWLRLELNEIERPEDVIHTAGSILRNKGSGASSSCRHAMCIMMKGLCSSAQNCDHESVAIQAPYFLNQNRRGFFEDRDRALIESNAILSYDPMSIQMSAYSGAGSNTGYRQNLSKSAVGAHGAYTNAPARPAPAMQFLEVSLDELCGPVGFSLTFSAANKYPVVKVVESSGEAGRQGLKQAMLLKRANGVDISLLTQQQVQELLRQRPLSLRFAFS
jgi:hypothetical protein